MVERFKKLMNKDFSNINQAALLLGFFALLSQIFGLIRDRALAGTLGPSAGLDIYYAAFRIPDFMYVTIALLATVTATLPFLTSALEKHGLEKAKRFFDSVFTIYFLLLIVTSIIVYFLMPVLAPLVAPGFGVDQITQLITISRIMLLSPILMGLSNLFASITQLYRRFFVYALSPVLYNLGILVGVLLLMPIFGLPGLAYGVILGAFMHLLIQIPTLIKHNFTPKFTTHIEWRELKALLLVSLPRTLGLASRNIALIAIVAIASIIGEGSISVFNFSLNLQNVPLTLIGLSYSVAAFPTLARLFVENNIGEYVRQITSAARQVIFWSIPITFLFIVLRAQIVRVILGTGSFSWADTRLTAAALALFSVSVLAQGLVFLFVKGYYAAGQTWRPLLINLFSSGVIIGSAYGLLKIFANIPTFQFFIESILRVEGIPGTAVLMLPLAFSIGSILNFLLLWRVFSRDFPHVLGAKLGRTFFQSFSASFFMAVTSYQFLVIFGQVFDLDTFWGVLGQGFFAGVIGIGVAIFILYLMRSKELHEISKTLRSKFWSAPVIAELQSDL
ncbi:MAG: putative peptidoglycan lipid II flippase [Candidatus Paceibacteria bacterium]|jgi:putative peptidoglycan lipid II flippase